MDKDQPSLERENQASLTEIMEMAEGLRKKFFQGIPALPIPPLPPVRLTPIPSATSTPVSPLVTPAAPSASKSPPSSNPPDSTDTYSLRHPTKERNFGDRVQELARVMLLKHVDATHVLVKADLTAERHIITRDIAEILVHHGISASKESANTRVKEFSRSLEEMIKQELRTTQDKFAELKNELSRSEADPDGHRGRGR